MAKLGYTWYPKDWTNDEEVFELNLQQRGLYRELIDLGMQNDNKTVVKLSVWSRRWDISKDELQNELDVLISLNLIQINENNLFIESCEKRLVFVRSGGKGGSKSKPPTKGNQKATTKPKANQSKSEIEIKKEIKIKRESIINDLPWIKDICEKKKLDEYYLKIDLEKFLNDAELKKKLNKPIGEIQDHFINWLNIILEKGKNTAAGQKKSTKKVLNSNPEILYSKISDPKDWFESIKKTYDKTNAPPLIADWTLCFWHIEFNKIIDIKNKKIVKILKDKTLSKNERNKKIVTSYFEGKL